MEKRTQKNNERGEGGRRGRCGIGEKRWEFLSLTRSAGTRYSVLKASGLKKARRIKRGTRKRVGGKKRSGVAFCSNPAFEMPGSPGNW